MLDGYGRTLATRRRSTAVLAAAVLAATLLSAAGAEVRLGQFWDNIGHFGSYFDRLTYLDTGARVWTDPAYWFWGLRRWSLQLGQTLLIAYAATAVGAILGLLGGVLASRNMGRPAVLRFGALRTLELMRTVPDIVFALIFVVAFGLGPLPGVLALALHTGGTLGKLFAEVIESASPGPVEGVQAAGGTWFAQVRYGILPQVAPGLLSYTLLRFEVNVRSATVIGFVGAGGIGQELIVAIRKFYYSDVSAILLMITVCVVGIDLLSERLRHRLTGPDMGAGVASAGLGPWAPRLAGASAIAMLIVSVLALDISPGRIWTGMGQLGAIAELMLPPSAGGHWALYLEALGQTLSIACLGTVLAAVLALPAGFLAARNVVANRVLHILARRFLDGMRSVDTLIWALIWINVVGLGPFAGALAIATSDFASLAKLMSEAVEAADRRQVEGVVASGGGPLLTIRYGMLPQIMPVFISQVLYFFESNTRSATIIGIVGAGGIGLHLFEAIRVLEWQQVSFLVLLILAAVAIIDFGSRRLRLAIIGQPR